MRGTVPENFCIKLILFHSINTQIVTKALFAVHLRFLSFENHFIRNKYSGEALRIGKHVEASGYL